MNLADRNPREEKRIYQPACGKHPSNRHARLAGKPVTVRWMPPVFSVSGSIERGPEAGPVHTPKWFGFVVELNKQIPEDELLPISTPEEPAHA